MPLPGTRTIHRDFSPHHEPTAEGGMTAVGTITRPPTAIGSLNTTTGAVTAATATVIAQSIPARIQAAPGVLHPTLSAGQLVTQHNYLVQVPSSTTGVQIDDVFTVDTSNDAGLTGRRLRVIDVTYGSEGFTLDLVCKDDLG